MSLMLRLFTLPDNLQLFDSPPTIGNHDGRLLCYALPASFVKIALGRPEYRMFRRIVIFGFLTIAPGVAEAAPLTEKEQQIISQVEIREPAARLLLKKIVNINSGTMNFDGVKKIAAVFTLEYEKLGFTTEWVDGSPFKRAGHFIARFGNTGPRLMLIGHLDTVFALDGPFQKYKVVSETTAAGPGIVDMKGGDVVMLTALQALAHTGVLDQISVRVILTGDEEKRGYPLPVAIRVLVDAGKWADIAIGFEDGDGDPTTAVISRRGASNWELEVTGRPAHSSQIFRAGYGYGSIYETARILDGFRTSLSNETNLTFNPGIIVGGTQAEMDTALATGSAYGKNNVIAETTRVTGDIRALTPEQLKRSQEMMTRIAAQNLDETSANLHFLEGYPPMAPTDGNRQLLSIYNQISQDLGMGEVSAVDPRKAGAADISFVAQYVDMAIDGLGLMGSGGHTVQESADIRTLGQQTKRAALLLHRLGKMDANRPGF